ncbi:tRNA pseudouridine(55) synthase TruB [Pseudomarimonas arenosa]|uniref:tRNA pseudouridine synthase B n=1 Tax=Pseudomarimonas arenosa TaxID=2774145 RepID=A0AAW3ZJG8_9GAMM|nr:tRNA pseudouridine(55) synthase TruB [Pseudomarimonas arenosa]MBD8525923.1 tRNA pseudouridine(55) synthase TruB [Pseudomarimonas arenosa]
MSKPRSRTQFRPLDGILLFDKPAGMSSNQALQRVRHLLRAEKGGHTGSLDPLATGLLPLCFGEATKIAGLLLGEDKAYDTVARLGQRTDTDDADGAVIERRSVPTLSIEQIEAELPAFHGHIQQRPPQYSALKQGGVANYARARAGEVVEVALRDVHIMGMQLLGWDAPRLRLRVHCGSGTYIRSLVRDLGEALGCGAHVEALRRLWVRPFVAPDMISLAALESMSEAEREACLLPIDEGLRHLPAIDLDQAQLARLRLGQRIGGVDIEAGAYIGWHAALAVGRFKVSEEGVLAVDRLFNR